MEPEKIEQCPICNRSSFNFFLRSIDYTTSKKEFTIVRCRGCNFLLTYPRPNKEEIGGYYKSTSYISHTGSSESLIDKVYLLARSFSLKTKRRIIDKESQLGNLLDFGCGTGEFIHECKTKGWKVQGIEPSTEARAKAESLNNVKIFNDLIEVSDNQYDAITLWHVLEHVHELNETLQNLIKLLKPNGTIFIAVPNHESRDATHYKQQWAGYDVPRHLWHFTKDNIATLLGNHGLQLKKIIPMKLDAYYVSLLSEQYRNPNQNTLKKYFLGYINGLLSNIKASRTNNYSSLIYIAKR